MKKIVILFFLLFFFITAAAQSKHPNLVLTRNGIEMMKKNLGNTALFDKSFYAAKKKVDEALTREIIVPVPKDPGGGYTHEKHKQNYDEMYLAGILYQVTGEVKYAEFIKKMLDEYAVLYPGLGKHPSSKDQAPGRLFWQSLNETVWLLHTIQAYDCIYDWLNPGDREKYENNIFLPMCRFFTEDTHHEFNLIHNHGTWMVASVGMTGFVLNNQDLVNKSLYGSELDSKSGFLAQLNLLFSPDGFYTEGGYYVRYALWPFFIYAESIQNNLPELGIYNYRNQILKNAFYSALQMTYTNGAFMPINDALKEKTFLSTELVYALNFVYERYGEDSQLLGIAQKQKRVSLTDAGLLVSTAIDKTSEFPSFNWKSVEYNDGPEGDEGGVGILRWGPVEDLETVLFKYTGHGLSHGHFDKLSFLFYDQGKEIIQDYGAARFINIEQKYGGRYLPENKTYALQTIAHNTLVVDEKSNYNGDAELSQKNHCDQFFYNSDNPDLQFMSATNDNAYPGVFMHRTIALVNDSGLTRPVLVDVFRVNSEEEHQYDLPYYYMGHFISTNFKYTPFLSSRTPLGKANGYQHLWKTAEGKSEKSSVFTWLNGERYYSLVSNADPGTEIMFLQIGANDPNFNLRNEEAVLFRKKARDFVFVSVLEPHGDFNPTAEYSFNSYSAFEEVNVIYSGSDYTIVNLKGKKNLNWMLFIANDDPSDKKEHSYNLQGLVYQWQGPLYLVKN